MILPRKVEDMIAPNWYRRVSILFLALSFILTSCVMDKGAINVKIPRKNSQSEPSEEVTLAGTTVTNVQLVNNQIVITGTNLSNVTNIKTTNTALSFNHSFSIESKSNTQIIANSSTPLTFMANVVFNLVLSNAHAAASFSINFNLCDGLLNGKSINCSVAVNDKDVLSYDAVSETWKPRQVNGLNYLGTWDASGGVAPTTQPAGSYYIISVAGTITPLTFSVGDWIVSNGSAYQKIDNSTAVVSVHGRTGVIIGAEGDYNLNQLTDVDLTVVPVAGKVLKYNGTHWVASDDLSGGGAGSVTSTEIAAGAVTDAKITDVAASKITGTLTGTQIGAGVITNSHINASAAIDYSKLNVPDGAIPYAKLTIADNEIPSSKVNGLGTAIGAMVEDIIVNGEVTKAPSQNAVFDALSGKLNTTGGTITPGYLSVGTPILGADAANKDYVDNSITTGVSTKVSKAGDTMTGDLNIDANLKLKGTSNYVTIRSDSSTATYTMTLPATAGTTGYVLTTDGSGVLSWSNPSSVAQGSGTVDSSAITDGSIVDADVSATANIAQSKIAGLTTALSGKEPTIATGSTAQYIRGDKTLSTFATDVINSTLSGFATGTNTAIVATDSVLQALQKAQGQIAAREGTITAGTTAQYYRGDKSWQTLDTSAVVENSNLYFTEPRVLGTDLAGFSATNSAIIATDSVLQGFNKAQGQIDNINTTISGMSSSQWSESSGNVYRASGNVGIGTTSTAQKLDVRGDVNIGSSGSTTQLMFRGSSSNEIISYASGEMRIINSGNINLIPSSNVGIGTSNPGEKLHVSGGDIRLDNNHAIFFRDQANTGSLGIKADASDRITFRTGAFWDRLVIDGSGNVGIGTSTPTAKLDIAGNFALNTSEYRWASNISLPHADASIGKRVLLTLPAVSQNSRVIVRGVRATNDGANVFDAEFKVAVTSGTTQFRVLEEKIANTMVVYDWYFDSATGIAYLRFGHVGNSYVYSVSVISTKSNIPTLAIDSGSAPAFPVVNAEYSQRTTLNDDFLLYTNGAERLRINSSGNIGIGITNPQTSLDVAGSVRVGADVTACSSSIAGAMRFNTPNVEYCNGTIWQAFSSTGSGSVGSTQIADGSIVDADVSASAAIAQSKIANLTTDLAGKEPTITAGTTAQYIRGNKTLGTFASDVLATLLSGLSTATNAVISASDSVILAFGKLQRQITELDNSKLNKTGGTLSVGTISGVPTPTNADDVANKGYVDSFGQWIKNGVNIFFNTGNVGIGTSTPDEKLTVNGKVKVMTGGVVFPDGATQAKAVNLADHLCPSGYYLRGFDSSGVKVCEAVNLINSTEVAYTQVANNYIVTCAIRVDSVVECWGYGIQGQQGDGNFVTVYKPVVVRKSDGTALRATKISAGAYFNCAIQSSDSKVYCWGINDYGQLGLGHTTNTAFAKPVNGLGAVIDMSAGGMQVCVVDTANKVWCWGYNVNGELGDGTTTSKLVPTATLYGSTQLEGVNKIVSSAYSSCAYNSNSGTTIYCWGYNAYGEIGDNTTVTKTKATAINLSSYEANASQIYNLSKGGSRWASYEQTCAVIKTTTNTYKAYCWGRNAEYQLADGTNTQRNAPVYSSLIGEKSSPFTISAFLFSTCILESNNVVSCIGHNNYGQLGNGNTTSQSTLVTMKNFDNTGTLEVASLPQNAGGYYDGTNGAMVHHCVLTTSGRVACTGYNGYGNLGNGNTSYSTIPVSVLR